jgi:hypothetical protein
MSQSRTRRGFLMVRSSWLPLLSLIILGAAGNAFAADPSMQLAATGDQVYVCSASGAQFAWTLKAPDATLSDGGKVVGKHYAGPTWEAQDGSKVVGEAIANSPSPLPNTIPWLVLKAKSRTGAGAMADVAYIVRTNTDGGIAPTTGCDATHVNDEKRVHYTATYLFFRGALPQ